MHWTVSNGDVACWAVIMPAAWHLAHPIRGLCRHMLMRKVHSKRSHRQRIDSERIPRSHT